jgi:hypothetical protein
MRMRRGVACLHPDPRHHVRNGRLGVNDHRHCNDTVTASPTDGTISSLATFQGKLSLGESPPGRVEVATVHSGSCVQVAKQAPPSPVPLVFTLVNDLSQLPAAPTWGPVQEGTASDCAHSLPYVASSCLTSSWLFCVRYKLFHFCSNEQAKIRTSSALSSLSAVRRPSPCDHYTDRQCCNVLCGQYGTHIAASPSAA